MAGGLMRYSLFRQDVSRLASWSVTIGTEDPGYLATNLNGRDPTAPAKLTTTSGAWRADLGGSPPAIIAVQLTHTNLIAGLEVRVQASAAADFGSLSVNTLIVIPALRNNWPINPIVIFAAQTSRYWRAYVVGTNPVAISIGHIALLTGLQSFTWAGSEIKWVDTIPCWDDVTEMDVPMDLDLLTQLRACSFDTTNDPTAQAAIDDWWFDARGQILPFVWVPDVTVNESYYMTFAAKTKEVTANKGIRLLRVSLKECGRGMLPTPWLV